MEFISVFSKFFWGNEKPNKPAIASIHLRVNGEWFSWSIFHWGTHRGGLRQGSQTVSCKIYYEKCQQSHVAYGFE